MAQSSVATTTVSIGKALLERSAVNAKITDILVRINNNLTTTIKSDGIQDATAENAEELLSDLHILEARHLKITNAITIANYETKIRYGSQELRIIEIMERIEYLAKRIKRYKEIIEEAEKDTLKKSSRRRGGDYSFSSGAENREVFVSVLDIGGIRKEIEKLAHDKNALQVALQEANWSTQISY
jgi:hypothetical protein